MRVLAILTAVPQYLNFAVPELLQMLKINGLNWQVALQPELQKMNHFQFSYQLNYKSFVNFPYIEIEVPDIEVIKQFTKRMVLISGFLLLFGSGKNYEDLAQNLNYDLFKHYNSPEQKLQIVMDSHHRSLSQEERVNSMEKVTTLINMEGIVDLKHPERLFWICEKHKEIDGKFKKTVSQEQQLERIFFGLQIGESKNKQKCTFYSPFELPNRVYLGPTSTDNQLGFLMANMAGAKEYDNILDPFVGTGSLLLAPTYFGANCYGSDLDCRVIQGFGVGQLNKKSSYYKAEYTDYKPQINLNFMQYGLRTPNIIRADCMSNYPFKKEFFDCIICDPPYGHRAISRQSGLRKEGQEVIPSDEIGEKIMQGYIMPTKATDYENIYMELLNLGEKMLVKGGMLVFLYPIEKEKWDGTCSSLPSHESFELLYFSEQQFTPQRSRLLITMIKK